MNRKRIVIFLLSTLGYGYSTISRLFFSFQKKPPTKTYSVERRIRSMEDLHSLYGRLREKYPGLIHIFHDEKHFMWRILDNPNLEYETYFIYESDFLRGYCYASVDKNKRLTLTDFTTESTEAGSYLLDFLFKKWGKGKIGSVAFLGNAKNPLMKSIFRMLKKYGFLKRRFSTFFVLKNILYEDEDFLYDIKNWYINALWTEGYKA